jgi:cytochrome P450
VVSPYLLHRDGRFFSEPERFRPDRWTPAFKASLPPFAYFPFGGGTRRCIGESFALMELVLVLSTLAQRWRFQLVPGHRVVPRAVVSLRMKHGLKMTASRRSARSR